jgi:hypothetical protein
MGAIIPSKQEMLEKSETARRAVFAAASRMVRGEISALLASRNLFASYFAIANYDELNLNIGLLRVILEKAKDLPLGPERRHWSAAALAEKDVQIAALEAEFCDQVRAECEALLSLQDG